jgi:acid phosphatase class B
MFKYHSLSESMDQRIARLEVEYSQKRSTIINMIYTGVSRPKVNQAVQSLADAFKLHRGDK